MRTLETDVKRYLSKTKRYLLCDGKRKREILKEIEESIYEIAEKEGITDLEQIYKHFGTPEETASTYLSQADPKKIRNAVNIRKIMVIGIITALLILAIYMTIAVVNSYRSVNGFTEVELIEGTTSVSACIQAVINI